jgi:hypothetical protein
MPAHKLNLILSLLQNLHNLHMTSDRICRTRCQRNSNICFVNFTQNSLFSIILLTPGCSYPSKHPSSDRSLRELTVYVYKLNVTAFISSILCCLTYSGTVRVSTTMLYPITILHTSQTTPFHSPNNPNENIKLRIK